MCTACALADKAWANVETIIIINSIPSFNPISNYRIKASMKRNGPTHFLSSQDVCQPAEEQLANYGTNGCGDLYTEILLFVQSQRGASIDVAQHDGRNADRKDVIAICSGENR